MRPSRFISTLIIASLTTAAPTSLTSRATCSDVTQFTGTVLASGTKIHFSTIRASATGFWIGNNTASACPITPSSSCAAGTSTIFNYEGNALSLSVQVPGGQPIYVGQYGALRFTPAHEEEQIPSDATTSGFTESTIGTTSLLNPIYGTTWHACPVSGEADIWSVFINTGKFNLQNCIEFQLETSVASGPGAYEYV